MSLGNPALAIAGAPGSPWQYGERFGIQPAGPIGGPALISLDRSSRAGMSDVGYRSHLGNPGPLRAVAPVPGGAGGFPFLPSSGTLDYAHKLTSTTLLVGGVIAFAILYRRAPGRAVRAVVRKHVGEV